MDRETMFTLATREKVYSSDEAISVAVRRAISRLRHLIPEGRSLPDGAWMSRHRGVVIVLWLHAIGIAGAEAWLGHELGESLFAINMIAGAALLAGCDTRSRAFRAAMASCGLVTASVILVHLSGGYIEMHFHIPGPGVHVPHRSSPPAHGGPTHALSTPLQERCDCLGSAAGAATGSVPRGPS
jgi:hypothetical protein